MSDRDKHDRGTPRQGGRDQTEDPGRPSQAEGDRETVEEALGEKGQSRGRRGAAGGRDQTEDPGRPSQAEGERGTVNEDLREKSR